MRKLRFKNLPNVLCFRLFAILTFIIGLTIVSILTKEQASNLVSVKTSARIIEVKIPPVYNEHLSAEERFWQFEKFLNPNLTVPNPIPKGIPNSCGLLFISIEINGQIKLNSEVAGNLKDTNELKGRLKYIFQERTANGVFEEGSDKTVKSVFIQVPFSVKYGDFIKLLDSVKESGANPIVLDVESFPATKAKTKKL
jgi:biopolymer transport protein ExbD